VIYKVSLSVLLLWYVTHSPVACIVCTVLRRAYGWCCVENFGLFSLVLNSNCRPCHQLTFRWAIALPSPWTARYQSWQWVKFCDPSTQHWTDPWTTWPMTHLTREGTDPWTMWPLTHVTHQWTDPWPTWPISELTHDPRDHDRWPMNYELWLLCINHLHIGCSNGRHADKPTHNVSLKSYIKIKHWLAAVSRPSFLKTREYVTKLITEKVTFNIKSYWSCSWNLIAVIIG